MAGDVVGGSVGTAEGTPPLAMGKSLSCTNSNSLRVDSASDRDSGTGSHSRSNEPSN